MSATVEAARWLGRPKAAGLVNATLRRLQRERDALLAAALATDEGRYSHPAWLIDRLKRDWPDALAGGAGGRAAPAAALVAGECHEADAPPTFARDSTQAGLAAEPEPSCPDAVRLAQPLPVARDPGIRRRAR